jgi:UDP-glucose 4-epimerase
MPKRELRPHWRNGVPTHLIKVGAETSLCLRPKLEVYGTDYPARGVTCIRDYTLVGDLVRAHSEALRHPRSGGPSLTLNCGYSRGYSVLEVIDAVKRVSGVGFKVEFAGRRLGDPAQIVASNKLILAALNWVPRFDNLSTIVAHALAWERKLIARASNADGNAAWTRD